MNVFASPLDINCESSYTPVHGSTQTGASADQIHHVAPDAGGVRAGSESGQGKKEPVGFRAGGDSDAHKHGRQR
jgi:hypothetical protein